jgi:hypothetical protein
MSDKPKTMTVSIPADSSGREARIKEGLAAGKVILFRNNITGCCKWVTEWNPDDMGDLTATQYEGTVPYVCWEASQYDVSYVDKVGSKVDTETI